MVNAPSFGRLAGALKGALRAREVLAVLTKHGLADIVEEFLASRRPKTEDRAQPTPRHLRQAFEELGPTFVKLGQALSTRHDLLDEGWIDELKKLQEGVAPVSFEEIDAALDASLGDRRQELFQDLDETPLAAGSIAQIHRARLSDGTEVVVKVLRPGIRDRIEADIEIMTRLAGLFEGRADDLGFSPLGVVREFGRSIRREVDLIHEGQATERFRTLFRDDARVAFPAVYWQASTARVLTLEYFDGPTLARLEPSDLAADERRALVCAGADAVFRQCLEVGFFHADPHPGNLMVLADSRLGFVDCGMTGQIDAETAAQLADLVAAVVDGDANRAVAAAVSLADADAELLEDRELHRTIEDLLFHFENGRLENLDVGSLLRRFFEALRVHRIRCPSDLLLLIKALTTIESVAGWLDPEFDIVAHTRPYIEALVERRYSPMAVLRRLRRGLRDYSELLEALPQHLQILIDRLRNNDLRLRIDHVGLRRLTLTLEYSSRVVAFALVIAAMIVGAAILVLADRASGEVGTLTRIASWVGGLAGLLALLLAVTHRRPRE